MEATMQRIPWWPFVLGGLALIAGGIVAIVWPDITVLVLVVLWGAIALVDGAFTVISGMFDRGGLRWFLLLAGIISGGIGVAILAWPDITALVLMYMIGAWAVVVGIVKILTATLWPKERKSDKWMFIVSGLLLIILGIMIIAWPASGAIAIIWLIGISAIIYGVMLIATGINVNKSNK